MLRIKSPTLLLLLLACGSCAPSSESAVRALTFSAIPDDNRSGLSERYNLVASHLSEALGIPFQYMPSTDYEASVEAFKNGDVQLAWFGGVSGVRARLAVPGARAIAQGKVDPEFVSYIIGHESLGLSFSESFPVELKGQSFTFGPRGSTSGRLMPQHFITQETGSSPEEFFGHAPRFTTGHDQTALQVQAGASLAGALNFKTYERMVASGTLDPKVCVHLWTTPAYADYNWTAHPSLDETYGAGFTTRLANALTSITDEDVLRALDRAEGLIPATNKDYAVIEATMRTTGLLR